MLLTRDNLLLPEVTNAVPQETSKFPSDSELAVARFLNAALATATRRAYSNDLHHFREWGGSLPATPALVAAYLAAHADRLSVATLARRLVTIAKAHTAQGYPNPVASELVRMTMRGIRRTVGRPQRQVAPAVKEDLLDMISRIPTTVKGVRDRAILLVGFAGAFRRSELAGICLENVERVRQGLIITIGRSKSDQEGVGRKVGIPIARGSACPVVAFEEWLHASNIATGRVFRRIDRHGNISTEPLSGAAIARLVKISACRSGLDPSRYSGHSLRAGLATSAAVAGVPAWKIRQQTGHASDVMLGRYIRDGELFVNNAASLVL